MNNLDKQIRLILKEATFSIDNLSNPYDEKTYITTGHTDTQTFLKDKDLQKNVIADVPKIIQDLPKVFDDGNGEAARDLWVKIPNRPGEEDLKRMPFPSRDSTVDILPSIRPFVHISMGGASAVTGRGEIAAYLQFAGVKRSSDKAYDLVVNGQYISVKYSDDFKSEYPRLGSGREEVTTSKNKMQEIWKTIAGNPDLTVSVGRGKKAELVTYSEEKGNTLGQAIDAGVTITGQNILNALKGISAENVEKLFKEFSKIVMDSLFAAQPSPASDVKWLMLVNRKQFQIHEVSKDRDLENPPVKFLEITSGRTRFAPLGNSTTYAPAGRAEVSDTSPGATEDGRKNFRTNYSGITIRQAIDLTGPDKKKFLEDLSVADTGEIDSYDSDYDVLSLARKLGRDPEINLASTLISTAKGASVASKSQAAAVSESLLKHFVKILLA